MNLLAKREWMGESAWRFVRKCNDLGGRAVPRYVILEHDHPELHWDFMLESGSVLKTWRLKGMPQPKILIPATASFDHRLLYLDFEGQISGNRGQVKRLDFGTYTGSAPNPDAHSSQVILTSGRWQGNVIFVRREKDNWTIQFQPIST